MGDQSGGREVSTIAADDERRRTSGLHSSSAPPVSTRWSGWPKTLTDRFYKHKASDVVRLDRSRRHSWPQYLGTATASASSHTTTRQGEGTRTPNPLLAN